MTSLLEYSEGIVCMVQMRGLGLWCLMPLSIIFQLYRGCHFIGGGDRITGKKH